VIDAKPAERIHDSALLGVLHIRWRECVICDKPIGKVARLSLHHIHRHPRDDVEANLVMVCGDGTTGCHGRIEARDPVVLRMLREHIDTRAETIEYLDAKLGGLDPALAWLDRYVAA
jgi:hypothetical protein